MTKYEQDLKAFREADFGEVWEFLQTRIRPELLDLAEHLSSTGFEGEFPVVQLRLARMPFSMSLNAFAGELEADDDKAREALIKKAESGKFYARLAIKTIGFAIRTSAELPDHNPNPEQEQKTGPAEILKFPSMNERADLNPVPPPTDPAGKITIQFQVHKQSEGRPAAVLFFVREPLTHFMFTPDEALAFADALVKFSRMARE